MAAGLGQQRRGNGGRSPDLRAGDRSAAGRRAAGGGDEGGRTRRQRGAGALRWADSRWCRWRTRIRSRCAGPGPRICAWWWRRRRRSGHGQGARGPAGHDCRSPTRSSTCSGCCRSCTRCSKASSRACVRRSRIAGISRRGRRSCRSLARRSASTIRACSARSCRARDRPLPRSLGATPPRVEAAACDRCTSARGCTGDGTHARRAPVRRRTYMPDIVASAHGRTPYEIRRRPDLSSLRCHVSAGSAVGVQWLPRPARGVVRLRRDPRRHQPRPDRVASELALALSGAAAGRGAADGFQLRVHAARARHTPGPRARRLASCTSRTTR